MTILGIELNWTPLDELRIDSVEHSIKIDADVFLSRSGEWHYGAAVTPYVVDYEAATGEGDPPLILGRVRKIAGTAPLRLEAMSRCEIWIQEKMDALAGTRRVFP